MHAQLLSDIKLIACLIALLYVFAYTMNLTTIELVENKQKKESNLIYEKM